MTKLIKAKRPIPIIPIIEIAAKRIIKEVGNSSVNFILASSVPIQKTVRKATKDEMIVMMNMLNIFKVRNFNNGFL